MIYRVIGLNHKMVPELPLLVDPVVIETTPLSQVDLPEGACIVMDPLLESVVDPELKVIDPPSPEPPPIDKAPSDVAPSTAVRVKIPPSTDLEAPGESRDMITIGK
mmetsp:Transcript_25698/g.37897  ORF Transcript_25698/g.37897 Transcript_25698/m.37897 type:complete len:106 (-) Transcript_25698:1159-1476(-)